MTTTTSTSTDFIDLHSQQKLIANGLDIALKKIFAHGKYILGPEVLELEQKLANFCGARHAISCANGTDSITLILMAKNLGSKDAVFVPSFTFVATAEVVAALGAQPIFIDVCPKTFNLDVESLKKGIEVAKANGLTPRGVIPVDLFGQSADYDSISTIAAENNLWILCDAAQSFGGSYKDKKLGSIGLATSTSFFPSKPLGCYGDGGCIFTDDEDLATKLRSLRIHGQGKEKYDTIYIGMNSRLDTIQATILLEKLKIFPKEIEQRQAVADRYDSVLKNLVETPFISDGNQSAWAQYTVKISDKQNREDIQNKLQNYGIPTAVYYPIPIHRQAPYKKYLTATESLPHTDALAKAVLSLPMHPYLEFSDNYVEKLQRAFK
jgi:dTDP-4-amino-4,6-dideoxygalactose transaminase